MTEPSDLVIPDEELGRQAVEALRGYVYQIWSSVLAWVRLGEDEVLLLEVADDYSLVSREALALRQVKDTAGSGAATLKTKGVIEAINRLWRFQRDNPGRDVSLAYLTTSPVGRERELRFPDGRSGLDYWRDAAGAADVEPLRAALLTLPLDDDLIAWLATADEAEVRDRLLRRIRWDCGRPGLDDIAVLLDEALSGVCASLGKAGVRISDLRDGLVADALRASCAGDPEARRLDRFQLLARIAGLPSPLHVPRARSDALEVLDPFDGSGARQPEADRADAVARLRQALAHGRAWLHGPSGVGKSALARRMGVGSNRPWYSLDLRDQPVNEAARRIRAARRDLLDLETFGGLVIEDFNIGQTAALKREIGLLVAQAAREDAAVLVTAYRAPAPSLAAEMGLDAGSILAAPYFTEEETWDLIAKGGGDPAVWGRIVHLLCGAGFPQLVAARVAGLRARNWPDAERLDASDAGFVGKDVIAERETTRLRLLEELPPAARSLLYRLSLVAGAFDRDLAMSVATSAPAIPEAGALVDLLVGPWLEPLAKNRLRMSPLLSDAGAKVLSPTEQTVVHTAVVDGVLARKPIPAQLLPQLLTAALITGHAEGVQAIAFAALMSKVPDHVVTATLYGLIWLRTDASLFEGDIVLNSFLRMAQVKVATLAQERRIAMEAFDRLEVEAQTLVAASGLIVGAAFTLLSADMPMRVRDWFPRLARLTPDGIDRMINVIGADIELPIKDMEAFLFTLRSHRLLGVEDFRDLNTALEGQDAPQRIRLLDGFKDVPIGGSPHRRAIVEAAWLAEVKRENFDPRAAADAFGEEGRRVAAWPDAELAVECVCAKIVLLAEYADAGDAALEVADAGLAAWPDNPRIRRERAKVLFRLKRFSEITAEAESLLSQAGDAEERASVARDIAIAAVETGDFTKGIAFIEQAARATTGTASLAAQRIRLEAERALFVWRAPDRPAALTIAKAALEEAETLSATDEGETVAQMAKALAMVGRFFYQDVTQPGWDAAWGSVYGAASRISSPGADDLKPNLLSVWYQLAEVEAALGLDLGVDRELEARLSGGRLVTYDILRAARRTQDALRRPDAAAVADRLSLFARASTWIIEQAGSAQTDDLDPTMFDVVQATPWDGPADLNDEMQRKYAYGAVTASLAFAVGRGETDWIAKLKAGSSNDPSVADFLSGLPDSQAALDQSDQPATILWALNQIGRDTVDPRELYVATAHILDWTGDMFLAAEILQAIGPGIAAKWVHVADEQRFHLRSPLLYAPAIRSAAEEITTRAQLARLVLAAYTRARVMFHVTFSRIADQTSILTKLEEIAKTDAPNGFNFRSIEPLPVTGDAAQGRLARFEDQWGLVTVVFMVVDFDQSVQKAATPAHSPSTRNKSKTGTTAAKKRTSRQPKIKGQDK